MYSMLGERHPGYDCFIFRRDAYQNYKLGNICVGINCIESILLTNLIIFAAKPGVFTDEHLTFHIGNEKVWKQSIYDDYRLHNEKEAYKLLVDLDREFGPFDRNSMPGSFLTLIENSRQCYVGNYVSI